MACRVLTHAGMKLSQSRGFRLAAVALVFGAWMAGWAEAAAEEPPATHGEPAWMSRVGGPEAVASRHYGRAAFRSMGALLLMIGALMGVNYWLKRRAPAGKPEAGECLRVRSRLRLGVRQELLVVDWEGDQIVLGIGPSFIQTLHVRRGVAEPAGVHHGE